MKVKETILGGLKIGLGIMAFYLGWAFLFSLVVGSIALAVSFSPWWNLLFIVTIPLLCTCLGIIIKVFIDA